MSLATQGILPLHVQLLDCQNLMMRRTTFYLIAILSIVSSVFAKDSVINEELTKDVPVNGTLGVAQTLSFTISDISDWRYVAFGIRLDSLDSSLTIETVGKVKITCGDTSRNFPLDNNIAATLYSDSVHCEQSTSIEITSTYSKELHYWVIVADIDSSMYTILDNSHYYGVLPGHSTYEYHSYRAYIGANNEGGSVDFVNVTVTFDQFSKSSLRAFVSDSQRPDTRSKMNLENMGDNLWLSISRNDKLFCTDCYLYIFVGVEKAADDLVSYNLVWNVDRGIVVLEESEMYTGTVMPDNHGQHFIIDLSNIEVDSDLYIGTQKLDNPNDTLTVDVSLTSFDDGEWDTVKTIVNEGLGLREWGISRTADYFNVGGVYYIRVWSENQSIQPCKFTIVYRITRVPFAYLYKGKSVSAVSKKKLALTYYRVKIPKEEFVDVQSIKISMSNLLYTSTGSFWYGFDTYYGEQSSVVFINNPKDPSTYSFTASVNYRTDREFLITEDEPGFCTDCTFGFSVRTNNETAWTITAELGYAPFMLQPNEARRGSLYAYTGGIETFFYLHQSTYQQIEVACLKENDNDPNVVLYVSTSPHANSTNHQWRDTTDADGRAEVEIGLGHPNFCTDCYYYIGVYFLDAEMQAGDTAIELAFNCPNNVCTSCKEGFDPAGNCKTCLPGYFGAECQACPDCNHGVCEDGVAGSGQCRCDAGWATEKCNVCDTGFWGDECRECRSCNGHGKCDDGLRGTGLCKCEGNFSKDSDCADCVKGFFGMGCEGECPGGRNSVCSGSGACDDGIYGTGYCMCDSGFVGLKCDTKYDDDKCSPHCYEGHGGCDEEKGECVCYYNYKGQDCNQHDNPTIAIAIVLIIMVAVVAAGVAMYYFFVKKSGGPRPNRKNNKRTEQDALLGTVGTI